MSDTVSIVVPIYKVLDYLPECIESILKQTYQNIEIILVDDGSPDRCGELCDEYAMLHEKIKVIHQSNSGLGMARNTGIRNATGKYITFIDGDDFVAPDHIERLLCGIVNEKADACYGGYCQQVGKEFSPQVNPLHGKDYIDNSILHDFLPHLCGKLDYQKSDEVQMSVCMVLYSLDLIRQSNILFHSERELISEDLVFNFDFLGVAKKVTIADSCGYFYRSTEGSLSKCIRSDRLEKQILFTKYISERTKAMGIFKECEQRILSTFLAWVRVIVQGEQKSYKQIGLRESLKNIESVCRNEFVNEAFERYDDSNLTLKLKLLNKKIHEKKILIIWLLSYLKSNAK